MSSCRIDESLRATGRGTKVLEVVTRRASGFVQMGPRARPGRYRRSSRTSGMRRPAGHRESGVTGQDRSHDTTPRSWPGIELARISVTGDLKCPADYAPQLARASPPRSVSAVLLGCGILGNCQLSGAEPADLCVRGHSVGMALGLLWGEAPGAAELGGPCGTTGRRRRSHRGGDRRLRWLA
jgi:hypothetical protein